MTTQTTSSVVAATAAALRERTGQVDLAARYQPKAARYMIFWQATGPVAADILIRSAGQGCDLRISVPSRDAREGGIDTIIELRRAS